MTEPKTRPKARADVREANRIGVRDVRNVIVLVTGTTAPGNLGTDPRSDSYSLPGEVAGDGRYWGEYDDRENREDNPQPGQEEKALKSYQYAKDDAWYWQDNPDFRKALTDLCRAYSNLHLFYVHGWSGDNNADNRRIAGSYLANRLCGSGGERAYYAGWRRQPVAFHLIGHSHGGNLINEFTKRTAEMGGDWPPRWKIRSITYLSTPFFQKLHQVKTDVFDPECKVINVHCQYDLTQRVVADFSLLPLFLVLEQGGVARIGDAVKAMDVNVERLSQLATDAVTNGSVGAETDPIEILRSLFGGGGPTNLIRTSLAAGPLYEELERLLGAGETVLSEVGAVVRKLQGELWFPVARNVEGKVKNNRVLIKASAGKRLQDELEKVAAGLRRGKVRLRARRLNNPDGIPWTHVADDIDVVGDVLMPAAELLAFDAVQLSGPFANLLLEIVIDQIEYFDNTLRSPERQLAGTPFASRIVDVDVTQHDDYFEKPHAQLHPKFVRLLEPAEQRYEQSKQPRDLMNLVLILAAQHPVVRMLFGGYRHVHDLREWLGYGSTAAAVLERLLDDPNNQLFRSLDALFKAWLGWGQAFYERDAGVLEVAGSGTPALGSLDYLMRVSHSVSRQDLYPPVRDALVAQLSTRLRRRRR